MTMQMPAPIRKYTPDLFRFFENMPLVVSSPGLAPAAFQVAQADAARHDHGAGVRQLFSPEPVPVPEPAAAGAPGAGAGNALGFQFQFNLAEAQGLAGFQDAFGDPAHR